MKFRYISDSHMHTDCSRDASHSAMMMCEGAVRLGLHSVTITDHCECNAYIKEGYDKSIRQSYFETRKAAAAFGDRLIVYSGVEIGQPVQNLSAADDVVNSCGFDFTLASVHNIKNKPDFFEIDYSHEDVHDLLDRYFDEIMEVIGWGKFDSLAHLTYPWRYIVGEYNIPIEMDDWSSRIDEILKALIENKKALELNTSGFRQKLGDSMPNLPILKRYFDLGGKLITLGSDAHRWADVGGGIERGLGLLQSIGFHHFTVYEKHQPKFLPIR